LARLDDQEIVIPLTIQKTVNQGHVAGQAVKLPATTGRYSLRLRCQLCAVTDAQVDVGDAVLVALLGTHNFNQIGDVASSMLGSPQGDDPMRWVTFVRFIGQF